MAATANTDINSVVKTFIAIEFIVYYLFHFMFQCSVRDKMLVEICTNCFFNISHFSRLPEGLVCAICLASILFILSEMC
jgi:hypothetical protein